MTPKEHKKLTDDAQYLVSSVAMAAARTSVARRAAEDALAEEARLMQQLGKAIDELSKAGAPHGSDVPA